MYTGYGKRKKYLPLAISYAEYLYYICLNLMIWFVNIYFKRYKNLNNENKQIKEGLYEKEYFYLSHCNNFTSFFG